MKLLLLPLLFGLITAFPSSAANPPVGRVLNAANFPPVLSDSLGDPRGIRYFVLAADETNATVIFDASASYETNGQVLQFIWGTIDEQFYPMPGTTWSVSPYLTNHFSATRSGKFYVM